MAAPPPVLTLAVDKGPRKGESRQCRAGKVLRIGRVVKGNDLAVRDVGTSQQHLAIEFLPPPAARWAISDLGSSNGSLLNGAPLVPSVPAPLSDGDLIKIGDSTVLAVSISSDSDPNLGAAANPRTRRSSRHAAAVVQEEKPLAVTVTRYKAVTAVPLPEILEADNEEPHTAALVLEEEKSRAVTRRGCRKKAAAAELPQEMEEPAEANHRGGRNKAGVPAQPENDEAKEEAVVLPRRGRRNKAADHSELENGDEYKEEEAPVMTRRGGWRKDVAVVASPKVVVEEKTQAVTCRGGREKVTAAELSGEVEEAICRGIQKKAVKVPELEKDVLEATVMRRGSKRNKDVDPPKQEKEEAAVMVVMRRSRRKKPAELPEQEKEDDEAPALAHHDEMKKDLVSVAPLLVPLKMRFGRGQGRVTRGSAKNTVLEVDEEQGKNELAVPRVCTENHLTSMAVKGGNKKKGKNVTAVDREVEVIAKALRAEVRKGRASVQRAASSKGASVTASVPYEETVEVAEVDAARQRITNLMNVLVVNDGEERKVNKVTARVASADGASAAVVDPPEEMDNAAVATRRGGRKKATVVTVPGRRKKDVAMIAPPTLPTKPRSVRGLGRVTRASARNSVLEENNKEEHEENEVAELREKGNPQRAMELNVGQEEQGHDIVAGDGEAHGTASRADSGSNGIPNTTSKYREDRKLKAHSTPFDIRLDRALKKYSA